MRRRKSIITIITLCLCLAICFAGSTYASTGGGTAFGFNSTYGSRGSRISGGASWEGKNYTGWIQGTVTKNGKTSSCWFYIINDNPQTGWIRVNGYWYYLDEHGIMQTGWIRDNGKWYYLMPGSGYMVTGWKYISGKWYYMDYSGAMTTGWQYLQGYWYYMDSSGAMVTGRQKINGKIYYFNSNGIWIS